MSVIPLFTPAHHRFNEAWARFRDRRDAACGDTCELTEALRELNEAVAEARTAGFYPNITFEKDERRCDRES